MVISQNFRKRLFNAVKVTNCLLLALLIFSSASLLTFAEDKKEPVVEEYTDSSIPDKGNYYWVIYDSVCPYCTSATKHIKSLDWEGKFKFISYRNPITYKIFPELTKEECEKDVHMVTPKGEVLAGYKVFRTIIDNLTATKILNPLLKNDYAEKQLNEIYEKMVKERTCYYNKTGTCQLKKAEKSNKNKSSN